MNIGSLLMSSGANTGRVRLALERISNAWGIDAELLITSRALLMTVSIPNTVESLTIVKRTPPHAVNFKMVSGISRMTWKVVEQKWSAEQINIEITRLKSLPHYNRWIILTVVSLAGVAFCRIMNGTFTDSIITFIATFAGLLVRQEAQKKDFNPYLIVIFAAVTSTLIAGAYSKLYISHNEEYIALATSVLFLVPGVPLINSFSDLIDGNLLNGILRSINGLIIAFSIALGLMLSWFLLGL